MTTVVGVRFREVGKIYYFAPGELVLKPGDNVIVDTVRGTEFGTIMIGNRQVEDEEIVQPLKVVRRKATDDDVERVKANREKEASAFKACREKIKERGLDMKLISAEYTFDNAKVLFYFTADGRVDFRELVKDLASIFKIRIELRQVGVRDETKLMGGLGGCGRPLCCASYLSDFVPVSIRMAKEQNLSLNPQKISGVCGRLMCCLKNEADTYEDLNTRLPKDGGKVITPDGREGVAETVNVLRERVRVLFTDDQGNRELEEFPASELQFTPRRKPKPCDKCREAISESDELLDEMEKEENPEIKALEVAELEDVIEMEEQNGAEAENLVGAKKKRNRHRRRRRPEGNGGEGQTSSNENVEENHRPEGNHKPEGNHRPEGNHKPEGNHRPEGNREGSNEGPGEGRGDENRPPRRRPNHRNRRPNNQNQNQNQNQAGAPAGEGNGDQEKNPNGAHRRFRKRRPKNNTESQ